MATFEQFKSAVGTPFKVKLGVSDSLELLLKSVSDKQCSGPSESFAIEFEGPEEPFLEQGVYEMEHPQLGMLSIFQVPVGETQDGVRYESVFNQMVEGD